MAEEESFTFVDKRGVAAESAPASEPAAVEAELLIQEEDDDDQAAPDVHQLLQYVTSLLATEAWHKLGLIANPQTGEAVADLPQAKVAIDVVADLVTHLEKAPETVLPPSGRRELRNLLNDLRLNYVAQRDKDKA